MELVHLANKEPNPKTEEIDLCQDKEMIPDPDTMKRDMTIGQDMIDLNLLVEDKKNRANVINREHNQDHNISPPFGALAANAIIATRTRRQ